MGRSHFGIASYVSRVGKIIQRVRYQNTYMDAKQVKSWPGQISLVVHHQSEERRGGGPLSFTLCTILAAHCDRIHEFLCSSLS